MKLNTFYVEGHKFYWVNLQRKVQLFVGSMTSSVARRGGGGYSPPIGMSTKMQNKKNTTFLALLRLLNALEWIK